jgi:hypothetical protein
VPGDHVMPELGAPPPVGTAEASLDEHFRQARVEEGRSRYGLH